MHINLTLQLPLDLWLTCCLTYSRLDTRCTKTGETTDVQLKRSSFLLKNEINFEYALTAFFSMNHYL